MSADTVSNPPNTTAAESKSARKKKAKAEAAATAVATPTSENRPDTPSQDGKANGVEGSFENPYVKELHKQVRNINKKLNSMHKVDAIISENPDLSLDDLVVTRKINADQKAQAMKKPGLQAQLAQLEEQIAQYKKFDQEYQQRLTTEKELLQTSHKAELEKMKDMIKAEATIEAQKSFKQRLLILSRFLRAAAARRQREDDDTEETKAFEGALLLVYGGDPAAVAAAEKLIDGAEESVPSTEGTVLNVTYAQIKKSALEEAPFAIEEAWVDDVAAADPAPPETQEAQETIAPGTDPTVAHAGLTEIDTVTEIPNGTNAADALETPQQPAATSTGDDAANAAAESQWDTKAPGSEDPLAESFEMVPRDPAETDSPSVPAPVQNTQSWADDTAEMEANTPTTTTNGNDGFHEVHHRSGGRGRGNVQGDNRGGYRGRGGPRGEGRGRGRGGFRGDRGGPGGRGNFRGGRGRDGPQH